MLGFACAGSTPPVDVIMFFPFRQFNRPISHQNDITYTIKRQQIPFSSSNLHAPNLTPLVRRAFSHLDLLAPSSRLNNPVRATEQPRPVGEGADPQHRSNPRRPIKITHNHRKSAANDHQITNTLSRLIQSDLLAVLNELIRQNHCQLALSVFSVVRSEPSYAPDLAMYAAFVRALAKNDMAEEIDGLIEELEREADGSETSGALKWSNEKTLVKLIRALVDAERKESTVRVYGMIKRGGWGKEGSGVVVDEYVAKVLARGFTKFGEIELAEEVELAHQNFSNACLQRV